MECDTYEEYIERSGIEDIIIKDKATLEGYIKMRDLSYRKVYNIRKRDGRKETLPPFIKAQAEQKEGIENKMIKYNWKKIIEDIKEKCYDPEVKESELEYYEHIMSINENGYIKEKIIDLREREMKDIGRRMIVTRREQWIKSIKEKEIEEKVIEKMMTIYIKEEKIEEVKKICRSIFVEESKEPIVYRDRIGTYRSYSVYSISDWIIGSMEILNMNRYGKIGYYKYKDSKEFNNILKKNKLRCVIIKKKTNIDKIIEKVKSKGVKNIIVQEDNMEGYCNERMLEKMIIQNKKYFEERGIEVYENNLVVENMLERDIIIGMLKWITKQE